MLRRYIYKEHIATFNGRHNHVKTTVLVLLLKVTTALSLKQITYLTGLNYHSLAVLLRRWERWNYILDRYDRYDNVYRYSIASRGWDFVYYRAPRDLILKIDKQLEKRFARLDMYA